MRTKKSILNILGVLSVYFIKILFAFVGKTFLIRILGNEYNGINALFNSIISMLSVAELGIGSAIIYNLYKPVKENNTEAIKSLMGFYKKCYYLISVIVLLLGILITPFIKGLIGEIHIVENIYILYYLFLLEASFSYLLTYKRSIFYAQQKNYIISICDIGYTVALHLSQIFILLVSESYILYLIAGIICRLLENLFIQYLANKACPFLKEKNIEPISETVKQDVMEKVKGLLFHKIGGYIVFGTDNMIMSRMIGIIAEGLYSNYLTVINPLSNIISQMVNALQGSIGNLLVESDKNKNHIVYKRISFLNAWLYTIASVCFCFLIQDFMILWLGKSYLFENNIIIMLSLNLWVTGIRTALNVFKNAAGIFYEDRYIPLIESIINLFFSIVLTKLYGIIGIFVGTFISSLVLFGYSYPVLVYKPLFGKSYKQYMQELLKFVLQWGICMVFTYIISNMINMWYESDSLYWFIAKALVLFIEANMVMLLCNKKSLELRYYIDLLTKRFARKC